MKYLDTLGVFITKIIGTMVCALVFTGLALISLPAVIASHNVATLIAWVTQTFIQLVLLPIIIVGQNQQSKQADAIAEDHYQTLLKHEEKIDVILDKLDDLSPVVKNNQ